VSVAAVAVLVLRYPCFGEGSGSLVSSQFPLSTVANQLVARSANERSIVHLAYMHGSLPKRIISVQMETRGLDMNPALGSISSPRKINIEHLCSLCC
jgi:hypothetical protein